MKNGKKSINLRLSDHYKVKERQKRARKVQQGNQNFSPKYESEQGDNLVKVRYFLLKEYGFYYCPLFVLKDEFERLLSLFPAVDYLGFYDCSINCDNLNIISKPNILPMLNKISYCLIILLL
eukprot:snap_masked-scaffold_18-processed-gene-0.20-mRNA-1 protein AED:1.00 eAED:1.00 QI:0/0/0/0/1/1/3/0/121